MDSFDEDDYSDYDYPVDSSSADYLNDLPPVAEEPEEPKSYKVVVCNIKWDSHTTRSFKTDRDYSLPEQMTLDVPDPVLADAQHPKNKKKQNLTPEDIIEEWVYDMLYRKFGHYIYFAQIGLPDQPIAQIGNSERK